MPLPPDAFDRQEGRRRRFRSRGSGCGPAADPRRAHGDGVRARRPHRRPAALRHPRVQDGEAPHRPPSRRRWRPRAPVFRTGVNVGVDITADAAARPSSTPWCWPAAPPRARDLPIPGRELDGIHQAMEFLPWANRVQLGDRCRRRRRAADHREGQEGRHHRRRRHRRGLPGHRRTVRVRRACTSSRSCRDRPRPAPSTTPWPTYPLMFRVASAHEEGGERVFSVNTEQFVGADGQVTALQGARGRDEGRQVREGRGLRLRAGGRPGAAGDGLRRTREARAC